MTSRRAAIALLLSPLAVAAGPFDRLAARWRARINTVRNGRPLFTRLRLSFSTSGGFLIEEYASGGQLAWIYKGTARLTGDNELVLDVAAVTDPNGAEAESGRARYAAGETYNLGVVEYLSAARVRVGALELQKELE